MTNNHVLRRAADARDSVAEFGFEEGETPVRVAFRPSEFFLTHRDLDFTIVSCDDGPLGDIQPIALRRNPAVVTRHDRLNIIQHPRGREKEIAIYDNRVLRIRDKVIWYTTDTEPGSSGSPVFDNNWDLVALHHAGVTQQGGTARNEGVRISAIVAHLLALSRPRTYR